ncbi:hypothetical protein B0H10DRAFT_1680772, partial [Mycena sp. CBHHK59/15]
PDWFSLGYQQVSARNLGGIFNSLLAIYGELEGAFKWEKGDIKSLGTQHRPKELSKWISAGRGYNGRGGAISNGVGSPIGSLAVFDAGWWQWWGTLQPSWREADTGKPGRFLRGDYPPSSKSKENWVPLRHPGQNGVLGIVATLYWWGKKVEDGGEREDRESWAEAVRDVKWM